MAPVKLLRPKHSLRKKNIDPMCPKSFFDDMMSISGLLGGDAVNFLSNDDKQTCHHLRSMNLEKNKHSFKARVASHKSTVG